jgi:hypothetical protein
LEKKKAVKMGNEAYPKLIKKIQGQIDSMQQEICSLEDSNFLNFLMTTVNKFLHPLETVEVLIRLDEMYGELNQLRGRVRSALSTYGISSLAEDSETEAESVGSQAYFSKLLDLLEGINLLEQDLRRKDARCFGDSKGEVSLKSRRSLSNLGNDDWEDLKLKF